MGVHVALFMGTVMNVQDANMFVFEHYAEVSGIGFHGVAMGDGRAAQTRCPCMKRCSPSYAYRRLAAVQSEGGQMMDNLQVTVVNRRSCRSQSGTVASKSVDRLGAFCAIQ